MEQPAAHAVFFRRSQFLISLEKRLETGKHLVFAHHSCGDLSVLRLLGAQKKNIYLVAPVEELLEVEEAYAGARLIADDLQGAVREGRRRFVSARLDARGPITDAFIDNVRAVIAHGMAQESMLTVNFLVGAGEDGPRMQSFDNQKGYLAFSVEEAPPGALEGLTRAIALADIVMQSLGGSPTRWTPTKMYYYRVRPESDVLRFEVSGPVTRGMPDGAIELDGGDTATHVDANFFNTTEEGLQREVLTAGRAMARDPLATLRAAQALPVLFNLDHEEIRQWLTNLSPAPPRSVPSSAPSSSPTSPTASRRTRLFRS